MNSIGGILLLLPPPFFLFFLEAMVRTNMGVAVQEEDGARIEDCSVEADAEPGLHVLATIRARLRLQGAKERRNARRAPNMVVNARL